MHLLLLLLPLARLASAQTTPGSCCAFRKVANAGDLDGSFALKEDRPIPSMDPADQAVCLSGCVYSKLNTDPSEASDEYCFKATTLATSSECEAPPEVPAGEPDAVVAEMEQKDEKLQQEQQDAEAVNNELGNVAKVIEALAASGGRSRRQDWMEEGAAATSCTQISATYNLLTAEEDTSKKVKQLRFITRSEVKQCTAGEREAMVAISKTVKEDIKNIKEKNNKRINAIKKEREDIAYIIFIVKNPTTNKPEGTGANTPGPQGPTGPGENPVPVPTGEQPVPVPTGEEPIAIPTGEEPIAIPTGEEPIAIPTGEEPITIPTGEEPISIPTGEEPITIPTGEEPITIPTGEEPITIPAGEQPANMGSTKPGEEPENMGPQPTGEAGQAMQSPGETAPPPPPAAQF